MVVANDSPELDKIFLALGNAKRRGMIDMLAYRPATISQVAKDFNLTLPAIHKHVRSLNSAKLIIRKKSGRTNFVALNKGTLRMTQKWILQYHTEWGNDEETLDNYISSLQE